MEQEGPPDDTPRYRVSYRRLSNTRVEFPYWFPFPEALRIAAGMSDGWVLDEAGVRVWPVDRKPAEA